MNPPTLPTRLTIDKLRSILDTLDINRLRFIHSLFRGQIMDVIDYEFIDEWQIDEYYDCAYDWFSDGSKFIPYKLNGYVALILHELQNCSPANYRKAMSKIKLWLKCDLYDFISDKEPELTGTFDAVINEDSQKTVIAALAPFLADASTDIRNGRLEAAASLLFHLMENLGKVKQLHKSWFHSDSPSYDMTASEDEQLSDYSSAIEEVSEFVIGISK